jgi:hypothetical protein
MITNDREAVFTTGRGLRGHSVQLYRAQVISLSLSCPFTPSHASCKVSDPHVHLAHVGLECRLVEYLNKHLPEIKSEREHIRADVHLIADLSHRLRERLGLQGALTPTPIRLDDRYPLAC